jgi:NTE family protein
MYRKFLINLYFIHTGIPMPEERKMLNGSRLIIFILIHFLFILYSSAAGQAVRPKIGLVLSGGGARGLAHIGTLKLLDSLQIPVDFIVGTSMGGIIGGLYACGYSGSEIEKFALEIDWQELFSDQIMRKKIPYLEKKDDGKFQLELGLDGITPVIPGGLVKGQNIILKFSDLTSAVESITDFDRLPVPYRCITVDLITGKEVILRSGSLARAMRATMTIPTMFSPVEWGDSLLIDGGLLNNFPADVAKMMGADIIIGVNVGTSLRKRKDLESMLAVLGQTMVITDYSRQLENTKLCDLVIKPELGNYAISDFDATKVKDIILRGDLAAHEHEQTLLDLKATFGSVAGGNFFADSVIHHKPTISHVAVSGNLSYTLEYFYQLLEHAPGDTLNMMKLNGRISRLKNSGLFDSLTVNIIPLERQSVGLSVQIKERKKPLIHGIIITGNRNLPFRFINNLLGLKAGDTFNKEVLNDRIQYMYGLGYFEEISYTLDPVRENYIRLHIDVKEATLRKLRLGFRYDDEYKLVGILSSQATNIPFTGLRGEFTVQFAGLLKVDWIYYYPSRSLNTPVFPYVRIGYKNIPASIFSLESAKHIAQYDDISWTAAGGFAFNIGSAGLLKIEYNSENVNIDPGIEGIDPAYLPSWNDHLRMLRSEMALDLLDDPLQPARGFKIDAELNASLKNLGSDLNYYQVLFAADLYGTFDRKHTCRLSGYHTDSRQNLPVYKYPFRGGSNSFIGMEINQIQCNNFSYIRFDYIYRYRKDILPKLIFNTGWYRIKNYFDAQPVEKNLFGFGLGIKFLSIIGPFELIFSEGSKSIKQWDLFVPRYYFTAGFNF